MRSHSDWSDPESTLTKLYDEAVHYASGARSWYLDDKKRKRVASRGLRATAIGSGAIGGLMPLIEIAGIATWTSNAGYLFIALTASRLAFDRYFGVSSAWKSDMYSAQRIQSAVSQFQYNWALAVESEVIDSQIAERVALIESFVSQGQCSRRIRRERHHLDGRTEDVAHHRRPLG